MISRGPFQPLQFCDSVSHRFEENRLPTEWCHKAEFAGIQKTMKFNWGSFHIKAFNTTSLHIFFCFQILSLNCSYFSKTATKTFVWELLNHGLNLWSPEASNESATGAQVKAITCAARRGGAGLHLSQTHLRADYQWERISSRDLLCWSFISEPRIQVSVLSIFFFIIACFA